MNVKESLARCVEDAYNNRATRTARAYTNGLKLFSAYLASKEIKPDTPTEDITIDHFVFFPGWLSSREYKKKTINVYISGAKYYLDWLVLNKYLRPDYFDTLRYHNAVTNTMRKREESLPRWPKRDDAEKMLEAVHQINEPSPRLERNIALVEFLYSTGCRANEAATLLIKRIDLKEASAIVTGKGKKDRTVFFRDSTIDAIRRYWQIRGGASPNEPAFTRHDKGSGKKIMPISTRTIQNIVRDVAMVAGVDPANFSPHYFRHAFAIKALRETKNLALVQDLMGHADPKATRVYAKIYPDELRDAHRQIFKN